MSENKEVKMPELVVGTKVLISELREYQVYAIEKKLPTLESQLFPNTRKLMVAQENDIDLQGNVPPATHVFVDEITDAQIDAAVADATNASRVFGRMLLENFNVYETNYGTFLMKGDKVITAAVSIPELIANEDKWNQLVDERTAAMFTQFGPVLVKYPAVDLQSTIDSLEKRKIEVAKLKELPKL